MKDPLGVSPRKGNQGTTRGKEKIVLTFVGIEPTSFSVRSRSSVGRVTVDLIGRSSVRFPPRSKEFFTFLVIYLSIYLFIYSFIYLFIIYL